MRCSSGKTTDKTHCEVETADDSRRIWSYNLAKTLLKLWEIALVMTEVLCCVAVGWKVQSGLFIASKVGVRDNVCKCCTGSPISRGSGNNIGHGEERGTLLPRSGKSCTLTWVRTSNAHPMTPLGVHDVI